MEKFLRKKYKLVVIVIMLFFITVSLLNAKNDSATFDEVAHIPASYSYITQKDMRLNPEHPPLLKDLIGLPLVFLDLKFDITQNFWTGEGYKRIWDDGQWAAGKHLLYEADNNPDQIIFWARVPIIILSVFLGLFLFMWGKEIAGIMGGLFILVLYAFDPNILGHNHYVTTDIGIAAFLTFAFYYFIKFIKDPSWKNVALGGFFLGLVNCVKFSSLMAYPILGLVLLVYPLIKKLSHDETGVEQKTVRTKIFFQYLLKGIAAFAISMVVVWVVYFINTYNMPQEIINRQINFSFPLTDPNPLSQVTNNALSTINNSSPIMKPFAEYLLGVTMVFKRVAGGNGAYFLNDVTSKASTIYFPFVFIVKETIPFLALIVFSLVITADQIIKSAKKSIKERAFGKNLKRFMQTGVMQYTLFGFIALYSFLSITGNLNIGLRHLFPIMPLAYLLVTKKVFDFLRNKHHLTKHQMHISLSVLILWIIAIPLLTYPNYVSYFNESVGGSKNGYKYVTDSNVDWGQDLKRLEIYLKENPQIEKINVDYFGGGNPQYYLGNQYVSWWDSKRPVESGWYAISVNSLQVSIYDKVNKTAATNYEWTSKAKMVDMIGNSIMIYYVP